jgi:hypothetical protein
VIKEERLSDLTLEVRHEVGHGLTVDVVVTSDSSHISGEDALGCGVVSDELHSV